MKKIFFAIIIVLSVRSIAANASWSTAENKSPNLLSGISDSGLLVRITDPAFINVAGAPEPVTVIILTVGGTVTSLYRRRRSAGA